MEKTKNSQFRIIPKKNQYITPYNFIGTSDLYETYVEDAGITSFLKKAKYKNDENFHILYNTSLINNKNKDIKEDVEYKLNKNFFRSDNFIKEHDGVHIVFSGCSETFGEGGPIEENWSYIVHQHIEKQNKTSGFFNLAVPGSGWDQIFLNLMTYMNDNGSPDYIFILAPQMLRYYGWNMDSDEFVYNRSSEWDKNNNELPLYKNRFIMWAISFKIFLDYCKKNNTKVFWSSLSGKEFSDIEELSWFDDTFIILPEFSIDTLSDDEILEIKDGDIKRSDDHNGRLHNKHIAKMFIDRINLTGK
jgi:hypothetical protein